MTERRWGTVEEVADFLRLSSSGVRKLIHRGALPAIHVGHSVRVDLKALNERLEAQVRTNDSAGRPVTKRRTR
ncbi:MAG: helix-turn-helix domain-containing protein [Candidatus Aminicenantales bacterium]